MRRSRWTVPGLVALAVTTVLTWAPAAPAQAAGTAFSFATTPALQPAFSPAVSDYAVRCTGGTTTHLTTTGRRSVVIAGTSHAGPAAVDLPLVEYPTLATATRNHWRRLRDLGRTADVQPPAPERP